MKIHLDTDLGGDIDDLCGLAMLLKWPKVEITGITTVAEENGKRAGYTKYVLKLAEREGKCTPLIGHFLGLSNQHLDPELKDETNQPGDRALLPSVGL